MKTKFNPSFFSLKNRKLNVISIIILLSLVIVISSFNVNSVSGFVLNPYEKTIIFSVVGSGSISWIYPNNTLLNGITYTSAMINVNLNDELNITATAGSGATFSYYYFNDVEIGVSGNTTINPLTTTPIISSFLIEAVFSPDTFYNTVNIISNVNGSVSWTTGASSGIGGSKLFINGTYVTFTAFPFTDQSGTNGDFKFEYYNITVNGVFNQTITTNPITIQINYSFDIQAVYSNITKYYSFEVLESTGGSLMWHVVGNSTSYYHGNYLIQSGTQIEIYATASKDYTFESVQIGKYLYSTTQMYNVISYSPPFTLTIYGNYTVFGVFLPNGVGGGGIGGISDVTNALVSIFGNIYTDLIFVIFGIICGLCTWKFGMTGLIAGIGVSTLLCTMAGLLPIWGIGLCIVLDVTLIILGSGLLNKKQEVT